MDIMSCRWVLLALTGALVTISGVAGSFPEIAKWEFELSEGSHKITVTKSVFKGSRLYMRLSCEGSPDLQFDFYWTVSPALCWANYDPYGTLGDIDISAGAQDNSTIHESATLDCSPHMLVPEHRSLPAGIVTGGPGGVEAHKLPDAAANEGLPVAPDDPSMTLHSQSGTLLLSPVSAAQRPILTLDSDGFYKVTVSIKERSAKAFKVTLSIELRSGNGGYLSAADWPLLPFYGVMCLVYVCLGLAWLIVSFLQWRDLLRIQFWIGGVIFLGMLEMATFYAEYSSYNATGSSDPSVVLLAELVSCCKRTLARMLVIIVSLGFGIVKPRLGPMLHRVVGVGVLYFLLAITESYLRVYRPKNEPTNQFVLATVPLAVLDSAICWWIFISLSQTTRTLRLRRNLVKLSLYRHFTNILIFSVVASVVFMLYSIKAHHLSDCFEDWRELWMDDAYWRLLFSIILVVIMVLWRPTNNNQKYAFSPLLDAPDDDDDDDEEDRFVNDAYGVKMRGNQGGMGVNGGATSASPKGTSATPDDDLKWVEENIPASLVDGALPILDSDEEIMATRFELSKMQ